MEPANKRNPFGVVTSVGQIGDAVRARRLELGMKQADLAILCGVGIRLVSEIERGKATAQIGKIFNLLVILGIDLTLSKRA